MRVKISILMLLAVLAITGCYSPKEDVSVQDLDLVVVDYDGDYNFQPARTFFLPDSISRIDERPDEDNDDSDKYDPQILAKIRANMVAKGFTEVDEANVANADVVLLISAARVDTYVIGTPCFWPCWGWGPWPPGWGWGPGWGWPYPPTVVGSYSKGSIFMNMVDPNLPDNGEEINLIWLGTVNGLLQGSDASILDRVDRLIDRAFELSPYLNR